MVKGETVLTSFEFDGITYDKDELETCIKITRQLDKRIEELIEFGDHGDYEYEFLKELQEIRDVSHYGK